MINCRQIELFLHPILCNINCYRHIETICDGIAMVDTLIRAAVAATYHAITVEFVSVCALKNRLEPQDQDT